jgi:hypothetical protein
MAPPNAALMRRAAPAGTSSTRVKPRARSMWPCPPQHSFDALPTLMAPLLAHEPAAPAPCRAPAAHRTRAITGGSARRGAATARRPRRAGRPLASCIPSRALGPVAGPSTPLGWPPGAAAEWPAPAARSPSLWRAAARPHGPCKGAARRPAPVRPSWAPARARAAASRPPCALRRLPKYCPAAKCSAPAGLRARSRALRRSA